MLEIGVPVKRFLRHAEQVEARLYEVSFEGKSSANNHGYILITEDGGDAIFFSELKRNDDDKGFKDRRR